MRHASPTLFVAVLALALPARAQVTAPEGPSSAPTDAVPSSPSSAPSAGAATSETAPSGEPELLDKDDPRAQEGVVVGARGIDPGWKDSRVAERSPSLYGQTGVLRTISARTGKNGYFDIGLHGRWFYWDDFIRPGTVDQNSFFGGQLSFGSTAFDILEFALATQFATNANTASVPATLFTTGDLLPSVKIGYAFLPFAIGADLRALIPTTQDEIGLDAANFAVTLTGLFTFDMYEQGNVPLRAHVNASYTYQNARFSGVPQRYLIPGVEGALLALTTQSWFYDQVTISAAVEAPLPYVTPFIEFNAQTALGVGANGGPGAGAYSPFEHSLVVVTPGLRGSVGRGLSFDLGVDLGLTGTAGGGKPDVNQLVVGQPYNPLWAVQIGISYTFSPFVPETQVEVRERPQGLVQGCVKSGETPVLEAIVEYAGISGPRIVVDDKGCFTSPAIDVGSLTVRVTHPDHKPATMTVEVEANKTTPVVVDMEAAPRLGRFKGTVVDEDDATVDATVEIYVGNTLKQKGKASDGTFEMVLAPGKYQVIVKADGFLQQGSALVVEPLGKTITNFTLKKPSKTRITRVTKEKIEISSKIPFAYAQARLLKAAEFVLDDVVDVILAHPELGKIRVEGHTDNTGEEAANKQLSDARAMAVVDYLTAHGVPADRLEAVGYGYSRPVATNDTEEGRAKNRRVEFVIAQGAAAP